MRIQQMVYKGDSNLGIFFETNENICLAPRDIDEKNKQTIEKILKTEIVRISIWDSSLIGLFCVLNSNGIILPKIVFENEIREIKKLGLNVFIVDDDHTAIGNLILANDKSAVISPLIPKKFEKNISETLDVEVIRKSIANLKFVGSLGVVTNKGLLLYRDVSEEELKGLKEFFRVKHANIGTANLGSPYVGSCIIANSKGVIVGEKTTPVEMERILEALGFV